MKTRLLTQINFLTFVSIALAWLALAVGPAHAASITFDPPVNISADTDVLTNGTLVSAVNVNGGPVTLNGVTFASGTGSFTFQFAGQFSGFGGSGNAPYTGLSANYQTLLASGDYEGGVINNVTISGLTIGHHYDVQIWCDDSRTLGNYSSTVTGGGGNSVTVTYNNSGGADGGLGQYVIGAFIADATTQTFSISGSSVINVLNAIQLRDLDLHLNNGPAAILIQPSGGTSLLGETYTFSVAASGAAPLGYQWYTTAPNTAITGATTNTYAINPVTTNSAASYFVVVTNLFGSVTSAVATLAVRNVSGITPVGVTASSSFAASNPTYLIDGSGMSAGSGGQLGQTANPSLTGNFMWYSDGSAVASTWVIFDLGQKYAITAADIWQMNQNGNLGRGVQTFEIWTSPDSNPADLTNDLGSFSLAEGTGVYGEPVQSLPLSASGVRLIKFAIASDWNGSADDYVGLSEVRFEGTPPLAPPTISTQPVGKTIYVGGTATFTASAQGNPSPNLQWEHNSVIIAGATNQSLILSNLQMSDTGSYVLSATNSAGGTNSDTVTLSLQPLPVSSQYAMTVLANNPMGYWRFNDGEPTNAYDYVGGNTAYDTNYLFNGGSSPSAIDAGPQPPAFPGFESTNTAPFMDGQYQGYASTVSLFNNRSNYTLMGWFNINPAMYPFGTSGLFNPSGRASLFGQEWCGELGFLYDNAETSYTGPILYFYPGSNQRGSTIEITNGWSVGGWNFVAATVSSDTGLATLYLNGVAVEGLAGPDTVTGSATDSYLFSIGKNVAYFPSGGVDNGFFPGSIDEVAAFDHALSASAIQAIYNVGVGVVSSVNQSRTNLTVSVAPGQMTLAWPQDHTGWTLEAQTNALNAGLGTNWVRIPSSAATNQVSVPINPANPTVFYRLVYP